LIEMHAQDRLHIDDTTLTPTGFGDRLDPTPVVAALRPRRIRTAA
jgi:hypothetical protein